MLSIMLLSENSTECPSLSVQLRDKAVSIMSPSGLKSSTISTMEHHGTCNLAVNDMPQSQKLGAKSSARFVLCTVSRSKSMTTGSMLSPIASIQAHARLPNGPQVPPNQEDYIYSAKLTDPPHQDSLNSAMETFLEIPTSSTHGIRATENKFRTISLMAPAWHQCGTN